MLRYRLQVYCDSGTSACSRSTTNSRMGLRSFAVLQLIDLCPHIAFLAYYWIILIGGVYIIGRQRTWQPHASVNVPACRIDPRPSFSSVYNTEHTIDQDDERPRPPLRRRKNAKSGNSSSCCCRRRTAEPAAAVLAGDNRPAKSRLSIMTSAVRF